MACIINKTSEEVHNIFKNGAFLFDISADTTFEDRIAMLEHLKQNVKKVDEVYWFSGHKVEKRVSEEKSKKEFVKRQGAKRAKEIIEEPDNIKRKKAGIKVHNVLADLVDFLYNNRGNDKEIMKRSAEGPYAITGQNFQNLVKEARRIVTEIEDIQKSIDPTKKAYISVEQFGVDPGSDVGGTADIFILFSDNSGGILDYKTSHTTPENFVKGQLVNDLLGLTKVGDYELNMNEYRRIFGKLLGIKNWRMSRLIPIHIKLKAKVKQANDSTIQHDYFAEEIASIGTGASTGSEFLKPIPLQGDTSEYNGINKMLTNQWNLLEKLVERRNKKSTNPADRDRLDKQISAIRKTIQKTIVDADISDISLSAKIAMNRITSRIREDEFLQDGTTFNPKYMSDQELEEAFDELATYQDIIENTHLYFHDLKTKNPKLYEHLKATLPPLSSNIKDILTEAALQREARILKYIGTEYKDEKGNLLPLDEVGFMVRNFTRFSNIDHPIFKVAWGFLQSSLYDTRQSMKNMAEDVDKAEKAVIQWAKNNGISTLDAYKLIINTETGHLVQEESKELLDKIEAAYNNPEPEVGFYELNTFLEINDKERYNKSFADRRERYKAKIVGNYAEGEQSSKFKEAMDTWDALNDLNNSKQAWVRTYNRKYLKIKDSVKKKNLSPEFQRISSNKALLDYYNMYVKYNNIFREMLQIDQYYTLPPNFIANVRKTMVDHLAMDNLNIIAAGKEFFDSLQVREDDVFIGDLTASGEMRRTIPILFLNALRNSSGEIDNATKSYDLSKNLLIFGRMAYNYKHMSEIEPKIMQLRSIMGNPSPETPGTTVTDQFGRKIAGKITEYATKKGLDTDTYKLFEELTDAYLYGIKFKDSNISSSQFNTTKMLLKAKQFYGKTTLAFAIIPAAAAYTAGQISKYLEGNKGISYNNKHMMGSYKHLATEHDKYTALALFYDVYSEDPTNVLIENKSANFFSRILTYRNMMYPLRKVDERIHDSVLNAMSLNWGIDIEGKLGRKNALVRLNRKGIDTSGIKSIWELSSLDKTTGKMVIQGLTKENFIEFRNAVKDTTGNIIGSLSQDDLSRIDTNLMYNIMFQFKSWAPELVRERFGHLTYDEKLQAARWGRYRAALSEFGIEGIQFEDGARLHQYMSKAFLPSLKKFTLDLLTFGYAPSLGLVGEKYIDSTGKETKVRSNIERAKRMYMAYKLEHPKTKMTFEDFLEVKEAQMQAMFNEIRAVLLFFATIHTFGSAASDDGNEPAPYMANWFTRFIFKNVTKAQSELTFAWNIPELTKMIRNPIPMTGLLTRGLNSFSNFFDETRDLLGGENSLSDKTPMGYYLIQWIYGGGQVARFVELYEQYKPSPYMNNSVQ